MADVDYAFIPKAQILASHAHANLDKDWGPFQSKDAALQSMPNTAVRKAGKKFGVVSTVGGVTTIEEYMFTKDNATDNDVVKLVLSSDDVTGTFDYTIGSTTSAQLSEAIGSNKIITIGTYIASVGRVGTSSSGYYVVCYTDEDGVFHQITHGTSTSSVGTETTKEFAEVETVNSISELGLSGVIGGIKKYQGNTMLDLGGVSGSGTLGSVIKNLISQGVHIDADDTNNVFAIKNINNETIGSITLGTNATNGAAELTFVAGSNQFTASLPNLGYDSSRQMLKYIDANGDDHDLIRLSNLQIKEVIANGSSITYTQTPATGDLILEADGNGGYNLEVWDGNNNTWQPLGSINNVSLQADQVRFTSNSGLESTNVRDAIDEVNIIGNSDSNSDLDISDENGAVLARFSEGHFQTKNFNSKDVNIKVIDGSVSDLDIADENGSVLARFADGHIETKHFNSRLYAANIKDKKISILGDSISTFNGWIPTNGVSGYQYTSYATYYPQGTLTNVSQTWWYKVITDLSLELGQNCSWSGSCVKGNGGDTSTAIAGCSDRRIADLAINGTPDIIIIFMGTNDFTEANNVPIGSLTSKDNLPANGTKNTFSEGYGLMLSKILQAYPLAHVFCCSLLDNKSTSRDVDGVYPTQNAHGVYLEDYNAKIKELSLGYGAHFIDLHNCGINWFNLSQMTVDSGATHPNENGHTLIANMIKKELVKHF